MEKICKACGLTKPLDQFHKDRSKTDGLNFYCKPCVTAKIKQYASRPPRKPVPDGSKPCHRCKKIKPFSDFHKSKRDYGGVGKACKDCCRDIHREWAQRYPEKVAAAQKKWRTENPRRSKDHKIKGRYGLPIGSYAKILEDQGGLCAICKTPEAGGKGGDFHIDHCHDTSIVRGLLCHNCNVGIGNMRHNEKILLSAIAYLKLNPIR